MILTLQGKGASKIIRLQPAFFQNSEEKKNGKRVKITPADKARQLGLDTFGRNYLGYSLEQDGELISSELENRGFERSIPQLDKSRHPSRKDGEASARGISFLAV